MRSVWHHRPRADVNRGGRRAGRAAADNDRRPRPGPPRCARIPGRFVTPSPEEPGRPGAAVGGGTTMTGPGQEGFPLLVVAPARPGPTAGGADIVFEMREQPDGGFGLPGVRDGRGLSGDLARTHPWA